MWFWFALGSAVFAALTSIEAICQPYINGEKEMREFNAEYTHRSCGDRRTCL